MVAFGDVLVYNGTNWQNSSGSSTASSSVTPFLPATDPNNPGAPETWHSLTLANGWTNSSAAAPSIRLVASPLNSVQIVLYLAPGTVVDGTVVTTVPSSPFDSDGTGMRTYKPLTNKWLPARCDALKASGSTFEGAAILVQASTGQIQCYGVGTAATILALTAIYPTDL